MTLFKFMALAGLAAASVLPVQAGDLAYPDGYRQWHHIKSMVLKPGHPLYEAVGGLHHIYANPKAVQGYRSGKFTDGAVIVFDLFEAIDKDNAVAAGQRKAVVVMAKNGKTHKATDGWGYEVFDAQRKQGSLDAKAQQDCHACHRARQEKGFVFSTLQD